MSRHSVQKVSRSRVLRANEADYYWSDDGDRSGASMMFELERSWPHVSEIVALGGSKQWPNPRRNTWQNPIIV